MSLKTLNLAADLRETISYEAHALPLVVCGGCFDDYEEMEWSCHWHDECGNQQNGMLQIICGGIEENTCDISE